MSRVNPSKLGAFEFSMEAMSNGGKKYSLYGTDLNLRNHFGVVYCQSTMMWLGALDSFQLSDEEEIHGKAIFLFAETSSGSDNLKVVISCQSE